MRSGRTTDLDGKYILRESLGSLVLALLALLALLANLLKTHGCCGSGNDVSELGEIRDSLVEFAQLLLFAIRSRLVWINTNGDGGANMPTHDDLGSETGAKIFVAWEWDLGDGLTEVEETRSVYFSQTYALEADQQVVSSRQEILTEQSSCLCALS